MVIDLNADVGEGCSTDAALLPLVTSANIACGMHAGDPDSMARCIRDALAAGVAIGAHPGYPDKAGFGRLPMAMAPEAVHHCVLYQIGALAALAQAQGARLQHVKPHGALYNLAATDRPTADAIAAAVRAADPSLRLVGLAGSALVEAGRAAGLVVREEAFADRTYRAGGLLVPRDRPGAVIEDAGQAVAQVLAMLRTGSVPTIDGGDAPVRAQTLCVHGDGAHAIAFARALRQRLQDEGIRLSAG